MNTFGIIFTYILLLYADPGSRDYWCAMAASVRARGCDVVHHYDRPRLRPEACVRHAVFTFATLHCTSAASCRNCHPDLQSAATPALRLSSWPRCQVRPMTTASAAVSRQRCLRHHRQPAVAAPGAYWPGVPSFSFCFASHRNYRPRSHVWLHKHSLAVTFQAWRLARHCPRSSCRCSAVL